ncbi:hypothetical protein HanPI659440_Chr15g0589601 [Helianthus annuus]|nr:hypothetical protein HanPI659440_Chr15g0589601 [Helianthus annuus]
MFNSCYGSTTGQTGQSQTTGQTWFGFGSTLVQHGLTRVDSVSVRSTRVRPGQLTESTRVNSVGSHFGSTVQVWVQILVLRCSVQTGHSQRLGSANQSTHVTRSTFSQRSRHPVNSRPGKVLSVASSTLDFIVTRTELDPTN